MSSAEDMDTLVRDWFRIGQVPHDPNAKAFLARCQAHTVKVDGKPYKYYQAGNGPTVLLAHGIHSNLGSMVAIAEELLDQDFRVVLFDAPAHGEAAGTSTDPIEVRELIRALYERLTGLHAVIGHSLGGLWALSAWNEKVPAKTFIAISAPSNAMFLVDKFAQMRRMSEDRVPELTRRIEDRLGSDVWTACSPLEIVKGIDVPGLIIHGTNDDFVLPEHAADLHAAWRRSNVELLEDAGHFDIVGAPRTREIISAHLRGV